jgi:DNA-binding phage protein
MSQLTSDTTATVIQAIQRAGAKRVADEIGVSVNTLTAALAGARKPTRATVLVIEHALPALATLASDKAAP